MVWVDIRKYYQSLLMFCKLKRDFSLSPVSPWHCYCLYHHNIMAEHRRREISTDRLEMREKKNGAVKYWRPFRVYFVHSSSFVFAQKNIYFMSYDLHNFSPSCFCSFSLANYSSLELSIDHTCSRVVYLKFNSWPKIK